MSPRTGSGTTPVIRVGLPARRRKSSAPSSPDPHIFNILDTFSTHLKAAPKLNTGQGLLVSTTVESNIRDENQLTKTVRGTLGTAYILVIIHKCVHASNDNVSRPPSPPNRILVDIRRILTQRVNHCIAAFPFYDRLKPHSPHTICCSRHFALT